MFFFWEFVLEKNWGLFSIIGLGIILIYFYNINSHSWLPDSEKLESLEAPSAAEEVVSEETENTQEVEVMPVVSPTIELPWTDIILAISEKSVYACSDSKETNCTSQPSTLISYGALFHQAHWLTTQRIRAKFQSSMSPKQDFSKFSAKDSYQLNQSLWELNSSARKQRERSKPLVEPANSLLDCESNYLNKLFTEFY